MSRSLAENSENEATRPESTPSVGKVNPIVFGGTAVAIVVITLFAVFLPQVTGETIGEVVTWISRNVGWFYFLVVTTVLIFVLVVALSRTGNIRLGPDHSKPKFNIFTWTAMLFAAGIGIDLMFFSVSEPITQYLAPPDILPETVEAARMAMVWTLFHYGIIGWGLYALMGLALAYFAYRHNLPLSIRSALYPIFGKKVDGPIGDTVDIAAMIGTIFGIATSLGIGVAQLNFGLTFLFGVPEGLGVQAALIALAVFMTIISAASGVEKGIRRLSELNVILAIGLMLFILFAGKTNFLMDALVQNVGDLLSRFPSLTLDTFAYSRGPDQEAWLNAWTLFFWAWWIAWAPFVGLFLARISRGRTIRQFVLCCLTVPFAFIVIWIVIFGNSALDIVMSGNKGFGDVAMNEPAKAFYSLLDQYPGVGISASIATFTGLLFYVTSADSGALVMSNFTSKLPDSSADGPKWSRIFWAVATGALTLAMLAVGGINTLQNTTIIMGLPFSLVLVFIMLGLYKALRVEVRAMDSFRSSLPSVLSGHNSPDHGRSWRKRLSRVMQYPGAKAADRFMENTAVPALTEVAEELRKQGLDVALTTGIVSSCQITQADLVVALESERDFKYQAYPVQYNTPSYAARASNDNYYRIEVFNQLGSQGYDLMDYSKDQLITDVLDHYERHLEFLHLNRENPGTTMVLDEGSAVSDWEADFDTEKENS